MRRLVTLCGLVYAAYVLEATAAVGAGEVLQPRWLCLAAAAATWTQPLASAVMWGGVCGLLGDALHPGRLGIGLMVTSAACWTLGWLKCSRRWSSSLAFLLATFVLVTVVVLGTEGWRMTGGTSVGDDWSRGVLRAAGIGALTVLWGAGLGGLCRFAKNLRAHFWPPLDWRRPDVLR